MRQYLDPMPTANRGTASSGQMRDICRSINVLALLAPGGKMGELQVNFQTPVNREKDLSVRIHSERERHQRRIQYNRQKQMACRDRGHGQDRDKVGDHPIIGD